MAQVHHPRAASCRRSLRSCHSAEWSRSEQARFRRRSRLMDSYTSGAKGLSGISTRLIALRVPKRWTSQTSSCHELGLQSFYPEVAHATPGVQTMSASSVMATSFRGRPQPASKALKASELHRLESARISSSRSDSHFLRKSTISWRKPTAS